MRLAVFQMEARAGYVADDRHLAERSGAFPLPEIVVSDILLY